MKHFRTMHRDPELAKIDRENATSLAEYFRKRAAQLRSKPQVLASDLETHLGDIARYEARAEQLEGMTQ